MVSKGKVDSLVEKGTGLIVYIVFCLTGLTLGLSYIMQEDFVFRTRSVPEGYVLVGAVIVLVSIKFSLWLKARRIKKETQDAK